MMTMEEIMYAIRDLANSQGFYGRLYRDIIELEEYDNEAYERLVEELEGQCFEDTVDMVLYFEC